MTRNKLEFLVFGLADVDKDMPVVVIAINHHMTMVGSLLKEGKPVALVKVDNLLYQVRPGNYLGQNYGRITKVGESEVVLLRSGTCWFATDG